VENPTSFEFSTRPELIVFERHGMSSRNIGKGSNIYFPDSETRDKYAGVPDYLVPLTEEGHLQSEVMGWALYERFGHFDYVYDSGYLRAIQTREGNLKAYPAHVLADMKLRENLFLRERDAGYTYDMTQQEADAAFPWLKEYWKTHGGFIARPPGGQSLADKVTEVYLFLNMLFRDRAGQKVLVITHGGTLRCIRFLLERWTYEQALRWPPGESPKNCGLTVYQFDKSQDRLALQEYNTVCY
jgi:broad specificity phosphatase PhoE